ncbi:MAG: restriction endonuclease subunit S [Pyrinomonadaceae bacterium]
MDQLFVVKENDLILNITFAWEGAIAIVKKEDDGGLVSHRFPTYVFNKDVTEADFFKNIFVQGRFRYLLKVISPGGAGRNRVLDKKAFLKLSVRLPSREEQQKIAAFLTAVDEKIGQLAKKKELLEKYKKGVMQKIFAQEIRFKDDNGNDFPEWEMLRIGDFTQVTAGATPSTLKSEFWGGDIRWMNSGELNLKRVNEVEHRITDLGLASASTRMLPKFCILIGLAGQGKTRGTVAINMIELCTNQSIGAIHPNRARFVADFLYHNLDFRYDELRSLSTGDGGRGGLNLQIIRSLKVNLPSVPEQKKIADFLSAIDEKIDLVNQQLEKTKTFKKGLLQQMFV